MWKSLLKFIGNVSLPGIWYNNIAKLLGSKNTIYDTVGSSLDTSSDNSNGFLRSIFGNIFGTNMTGQQIESISAEEQSARNLRSTSWQDTVSDMRAAGVNPAAAFGSGPTSTSIPSPGVSQGVNLADLFALAKLPAEIGLIKSQINQNNANASNLNEMTNFHRVETALRSVMLSYYPDLTQAQIDSMRANIDKVYSDIDVNISNISYINSQNEAQDILNEYLPARQEVELKRVSSEINNLDASAKLNKVRSLFEDVQYQFAKKNGFLMSSNDTLNVVTYIASLFGLGKDSVTDFVSIVVPKIVREVVENSHLGTPGGPHK